MLHLIFLCVCMCVGFDCAGVILALGMLKLSATNLQTSCRGGGGRVQGAVSQTWFRSAGGTIPSGSRRDE